MKIVLTSALGLVALLALPLSALAHAYPANENPPSGAVLKQLPAALSIAFTETINRHFSGIVVKGPNGRQVSFGAAMLAPGNAKTLIVHLRKSHRTGRYTVLWHALASDGHRTHGSYGFELAR
ncbi:copper resistance protein CopC [Acidiphilium sp. PA]|uniref:copper resistance CopC family protein n=1 Tax=Acidiphilium sp. PA TaxID=2871705 RepID=UPI002242CA8E|nr:copper resistance protein CopC [Acidiphilium sp. PA]MCW8308038.1 copper resistance protein CopC [Acidiphilium sp. PA]